MNDMTHYRKFIPVSIQSGKPSPLSIQQEMERVMNYFNREFDFTFPAERFEDLALHPSIDIIDDKDHFKIEVEMPGMGEATSKLPSVMDCSLLKGKKETSKKDEGEKLFNPRNSLWPLRAYGCLARSVDISQAKALFKKGMLWVDIPKRSEVVKQSREIKVDKVE